MLIFQAVLEDQLLISSKQIYIRFTKNYDQKEIANNFVQKLGLGDPTTCVYKFIYNENDNNDTKINIFYYAWIGIMYQGRQLCGPYVLCIVIQS